MNLQIFFATVYNILLIQHHACFHFSEDKQTNYLN